MYRELVGPYAAEIQWVKIEKPAREKEISKAERVVGYSFPPELRVLLLEMNGDHWLLLSTDQIIEITKLTRQGLAEDDGIERHIFFATNGCGDYYCYNVSPSGKVDSSAIFLWEHESNETKRVASDVKELIERYYHDEI